MDVGPSVPSSETPAALFPTSLPVPASPQLQASTPASRLAFPGNPPQAVRMASKLFKQISHPYRPDPGRLGSHPAALMGDGLYSPAWLLLDSGRGAGGSLGHGDRCPPFLEPGTPSEQHLGLSSGQGDGRGIWDSHPRAWSGIPAGCYHPSPLPAPPASPARAPTLPSFCVALFGPDMNVLEQKAQESVRPWCPEVPKGASLGFIDTCIRVEHASEC